MPLIAQGQVLGVLSVCQRSIHSVTGEWMGLLEAVSNQTTLAIEHARLFEDLQRSSADLGMAYVATIEGWSRALDLRDKKSEGHSQR